MWRFFLSEIFVSVFGLFFYRIFFTFQDILNYLDSSNTSTETGKAPSVTDNNTSSNPLYSNPKLSHLYQNQSSHPESPSNHNSLQNHLQELMDTEAELEKLTRTMTAFQKPIPPPRQVFLRKLSTCSKSAFYSCYFFWSTSNCTLFECFHLQTIVHEMTSGQHFCHLTFHKILNKC